MLNLNNRTLILDLRDNMGGNVLLANKFLENFFTLKIRILNFTDIQEDPHHDH